MPLALARDHILKLTNRGDLVLDLMAGSGTVIRAAIDLARLAIESKGHYCRLMIERMAQEVMAL